MTNDAQVEAVGELLGALEECLAEIVTLSARVTPQVRRNLEATADRAQDALAKASAVGLRR